MNLYSCENCGVVVDVDRMERPSDLALYGRGGELNLAHWHWDGEEHWLMLECPCCKQYTIMNGETA